jgi:hypothetical protein
MLMFAPYTPIDRCIGREISVRTGGETFTGMLAGVYHLGGVPVLVITPMDGRGMEQHIPLPGAVVTVRQE